LILNLTLAVSLLEIAILSTKTAKPTFYYLSLKSLKSKNAAKSLGGTPWMQIRCKKEFKLIYLKYRNTLDAFDED
jgi:hypothetical protein